MIFFNNIIVYIFKRGAISSISIKDLTIWNFDFKFLKVAFPNKLPFPKSEYFTKYSDIDSSR